MKKTSIKKINTFLGILVFFIAVVLLFGPYVPYIRLYVDQKKDNTSGYRYHSALAEHQHISSTELVDPPSAHVLVIPSIGVNAEIHEGEDAQTLNLGVWRRPRSSSPVKGGNTVLTGHRYQRVFGSNTFYLLNKLQVDDQFLVFWDGVEYDYRITEISIVDPSHVEIEQQTSEPIITLYTCTPLWTAKDRIVIKAKLITL